MLATLKDCIHRMLQDSPVPPRQLAEELGVSYSYLMNAGNPDLSEFKLAARLIVPLTRLTGDFSAINFIENSLGRQVFTLPTTSGSDIKSVQARLLATVGGFGQLTETSAAALADGKISAREALELERLGYHLITEILEYLRAVETCRKERAGYVG